MMHRNMDVVILSGPPPISHFDGLIKPPHFNQDNVFEYKKGNICFSPDDTWKDWRIPSPILSSPPSTLPPPPLLPPPPPIPVEFRTIPPPPVSGPPPPIGPPPPLLLPQPPQQLPPLSSPPTSQPQQQQQGEHLNHGKIVFLNDSHSLKSPKEFEVPTKKVSTVSRLGSGYGDWDKSQLAAPDLESMDEIWHGEFSKVFTPYLPHIWYLSPTDMCPSPRWRRFKDSAKVRFCCQTCGHGWTSMKGRVVFWYLLHLPFCEGYVQFKLYGQQCMRCNNGIFEPAMWYPEEVNKVLCNLYNRIGQTYYGFVKPPIRYDRRAGKPRTQHNAALCQACRDGECDSRPRTGPATPGPQPHGVITTMTSSTTSSTPPTKIPPPTVSATRT